MKGITAIAISLGLVLLGVRCSRQATEYSGGSTNTSNARLAGIVFDKNGMPEANASVILRNIIVTANGDSLQNEWRSTTNGGGDYFFDSLPTGTYVLAGYDDEMLTADYNTRFPLTGDTIAQLSLSRLLVLKGRVLADSSVSRQTMVVTATGVVRPVHPDNQGFYVIAGIPRGQFDIAFIHNSTVDYLPIRILSCGSCLGDTVYARDVSFAKQNTTTYSYFRTTLPAAYSVQPVVYAPGTEPSWYAGKDFSLIEYFSTAGLSLNAISDQGAPAVLLDNFDDRDNASSINAITGKALWYVYTDASFGGNSTALPLGVVNLFSLGITDSASYAGSSMHTTAILSHTIQAPYAGIAINVEPHTTASADFSAMQSFSFMLKGKGQIRVIFWSRLATNSYPDSQMWGQFGTTLQCPPSWTKTVIRPQDITTPLGSRQHADSLKWQEASSNVFRIEFSTWQETNDTVGIWIDQVYLNGISDSIFK
jgi:hypothetical protein